MNNEQKSRDTESLIEGLEELPTQAFDSPDMPPGVKDRVYASTLDAMRRRKTVKRVKAGAALGLTYAAGIATAFLVLSGQTTPDDSGGIAQQQPEIVPATSPKPDEPATKLDPAEKFALRLSSATDEEKPAILREAGDYYLNTEDDVAAAVNCYQRYLELLPRVQVAKYEPSDTWLLATLRESYDEEIDNEIVIN